MGDILLDWLNYQLKLSCPIASLDKDFRNGYLLGEVLHLHNWQCDFAQFENKQTPDARIKNFTLLEKTLRSMGIQFDTRTAADIMKGKPGVVAKILFQSKIKFDRLGKFAAPTSTRGESIEGVKPLPNLPQRGPKPVHNSFEHRHFDDTIRYLAGSSKELLELKALRRFYEEGQRQRESVETYRNVSRSQQMALVEATRKDRLRLRREEQDFMRTWNEVNVMHWVHNQELALARQQLRLKVQRKAAGERRRVKEMARERDMRDVRVGLEAFDPDAALLEQAPVIGDQGEKTLGEAFAQSREEMRVRKAEEAALAALRESRRRQFMCEHEQSQVAGVSLRVEEQLARACVADAQLEEVLGTVARHEKLFTENRAFREEQYRARVQRDEAELQRAHSSFLQVLMAAFERDLRGQWRRYEDAPAAREAARATRVSELCVATTYRLVDLALEAVAYRAFSQFQNTQYNYNNSSAPIPPTLWRDAKAVFVTNLPLLTPDQGPPPSSSWLVLEEQETALYLSGRAWPWSESESESDTPAAQDQSPITDAAVGVDLETNALLRAPCHLAFGEVLLDCSLTTCPLPPVPPPPDLPRFDVCMAVLGKTYAGKTRQAKEAARRFHLKVLSVRELVQEAMERAQQPLAMQSQRTQGEEGGEGATPACQALQAENAEGWVEVTAEPEAQDIPVDPLDVQVHELGLALRQELANGENVTDDMACALITLAIRRLGRSSPPGEGDVRGWVLDDFPEDLNQATLLEKALSGYDPSQPPPTRWSRQSPLAPCLPPPPPSIALVPSGLDLCFHLQASREQALTNHMARRHDDTSGQDFQLLGITGPRPPHGRTSNDALQPLEDPANPQDTAAYRMAAHDVESSDLMPFLSRFGHVVCIDTTDHDAAEVFAQMEPHIYNLGERKKAERAEREAAALARAEQKAAREAQEAAEAEATAAQALLEQQHKAAAEAEALALTQTKEPRESIAKGTSSVPRRGSGNRPVTPQAPTAPAPAAPAPVPVPVTALVPSLPPPPRRAVSEVLGAVLTQQWDATQHTFLATIKSVFRSLRVEELGVASYIRDLRLAFQSFLRRPDEKQVVVSSFQQAFNSLETDLRYDDDAKAELLLRNEELRDALWRIVEARRNECTLLLNGYRENGWLELQASLVQLRMSSLAQMEVDRFHALLHVLLDFFDATCGEPKHTHQGTLTNLSNSAATEPPKKGAAAAAKKGKEPAAESVMGLRTLHPPNLSDDVAREVAAAAAAAAAGKEGEVEPVKGKGAKANKPAAAAGGKGKGNKGEVTVTDEAPRPAVPSTHVLRPPTVLQGSLSTALAYADKWSPGAYPVPPVPGAYSEEQAKALQARHAVVWHEASLLRARLERIGAAGQRLQEALVSCVSRVYEEVGAWIEAQSRREEASVEALVALVLEAVEHEQALPWDLRFDCDTLKVDRALRHVAEAPLPVPPRVLPLEPLAFNADQLRVLSSSLEALAQAEAPHSSSTHTGGAQPWLVSKQGLIDTVARLCTGDVELPLQWAQQSASPWAMAKALEALESKKSQGTGTELVNAEEWLNTLPRAA